MVIRTTITISEEAYKKLVELAIENYGHARAISKVIEDLLREKNRKTDVKDIIEKAKKINIKIDLKSDEIDKLIEKEVINRNLGKK